MQEVVEADAVVVPEFSEKSNEDSQEKLQEEDGADAEVEPEFGEDSDEMVFGGDDNLDDYA